MIRYFYTDPLAAAWMAKHFAFTLYLGNLEADDFDAYSTRAPHMIVEDLDYRRITPGITSPPLTGCTSTPTVSPCWHRSSETW